MEQLTNVLLSVGFLGLFCLQLTRMCRNTPSGMTHTSTNYHIVEVLGIQRGIVALMPDHTSLNRCECSVLACWLTLSLAGRRVVCEKCTWCWLKNKAST